MASKKLFGGKSLVDLAKEGQQPPADNADASAPASGDGSAKPAHFVASQMALRGPVPIAERRAILKVDPKRCRMWAHHDRDSVWYTPESCADMISSIRKSGQKEPAVARRVEGEADCDYEIVTGGRRRYACEELGISLHIALEQITDREAAVRMHIENHDRQDISPMERALSYARHLKAGLFKNQEELANEILMSAGQVTKMMRAASLMEVPAVRKLISDVRAVPLEDAYRVASSLADEATRGIVVKAAEQMGRSGSHQGKSASAVLKLLLLAPSRSTLSVAMKKDYNVGVQEKCTVTRNSKGKVTLAFPKGFTEGNRTDVLAAIERVVDELVGSRKAVS